jgi:hypothetical protein
VCGSLTPCAVYFSSNYFSTTLSTVLYSWTFSVIPGFNELTLSTFVPVNRGNLVLLTQPAGTVAIDLSSYSLYSDMVFITANNFWANLFYPTNRRFMVNPITSFKSYQYNLAIAHSYASLGSYNLVMTLGKTAQTITQSITITACNFKIK